jgi:Anti-sigma factor NepR
MPIMKRERNPLEKTFYLSAIQTKIGQGLRAQYDEDLAQPLPHRLFTLLMRLGERKNTERSGRREKNKPVRRANDEPGARKRQAE